MLRIWRSGPVGGSDVIVGNLDPPALAEALEEVRSGNWDVVILDEINVAVHLGLIPVGEVLRLLESRPDGIELILTGRMAPRELVDRADLVTEMREIKHYFNSGVAARKGIEH